MSYERIKIWDGTNSLGVTNSSLPVFAKAPKASSLGETTVNVGLSITLIGPSNSNRIGLYLFNKGLSGIYLSTGPSMTGGPTGLNFELLTALNRRNFTDYTGPLYGILAAGPSGSVVPIGVLDISA